MTRFYESEREVESLISEPIGETVFPMVITERHICVTHPQFARIVAFGDNTDALLRWLHETFDLKAEERYTIKLVIDA